MKIKVFKFIASNCIYAENPNRRCSWWADIEARLPVSTEEEIENRINEFMLGLDIVDVKVNVVDLDESNNGYGKTAQLIYTILYR